MSGGINRLTKIVKLNLSEGRPTYSERSELCSTAEQIKQSIMERAVKKNRNIDIDKSLMKTIIMNDNKDDTRGCNCGVCKYSAYNENIENICKTISKVYYTTLVKQKDYYLPYTKNKHDFLTNYINNSLNGGVSQLIYKINYLHRLFYNAQYPIFKQLTHGTNQSTSKRKHPRYYVNFSFNDLQTLNTYVGKCIKIGDVFCLRPRQMVCKNGQIQEKKDYKVLKLMEFEMVAGDNGWLYHITPTYIMRFRPNILLELEPPNKDDIFVDSSINAFNHMLISSGINIKTHKNFLCVYTAEIIKKNRTNADIFDTLTQQKKYDTTNKKYDLFTAFNLSCLINVKYVLTDKIHNHFNEINNFDKYLEQLNKQAKHNNKKVLETDTHIIRNSNTDTSESESNSDSEEETDNNDNNDNNEAVKEAETHEVKKYEFSYNPSIDFKNKNLIESCISELLVKKEKARELFSLYNKYHIIKDITKTYTNDRYINVILINTKTNRHSPQYHLYLNKYNHIRNITYVENII